MPSKELVGQNAAAPGVPIGLLDVYNHHWNAGISMFIIIIIIIIENLL